jgi:hypothetical protein
MFPRDLRLLGYEDIVDPKVGGKEMGVDESGTFIRSDLILAFREYFYHVEELRSRPKDYDSFAYRVS